MKKILTLTCAILLVVLLCLVCVACNRTDSNDDGNNNGGNNQYEVAKYTVTFNTLSNYTFENNVLTGVVAGSKIKAPTNDKGEKLSPPRRDILSNTGRKTAKKSLISIRKPSTKIPRFRRIILQTSSITTMFSVRRTLTTRTAR